MAEVTGPDRDTPTAQPPATGPRIARGRSSAGAVLPDTTSDEQDIGWGEIPEPEDDERLRREVPPHHGN